MKNKIKSYINTITKNKDLRNLWVGLTISYLGDSFYQLAIAWHVFSQTGSSLQVGLIMVTKFLPDVLLGPFFGVIVDRYHRKRLMQIAILSQIFVTGILALSIIFGFFSLALLYILTFFLSLGSLLFFPSQRAWLPHIVDKDQLMIANSFFSTSREMANLFGALLGGTIVVFLGVAAAIAFDTLSFVIALFFIQLVAYQPIHKLRTQYKRGLDGLKEIIIDMREGFRWLSVNRTMLWMLILATVGNMALGPINVLMPMLIQNVFHANAGVLGIFDACLGLGVLLGGVFIGIMNPRKVGMLFCMAFGMQGLGMLVISMAPTLYIAYAGMFILGMMIVAGTLPISTAFQLLIPSELRGRVSGINNMISGFAIPISYGFVGVLGDALGPRSSFLLSFLLFVLCMGVALLIPNLRRFRINVLSTSQGEKHG